MTKEDHFETGSYGARMKSIIYRDDQKKLIDSDKMGEAIEKDIRDIRMKFGNKYDESILQILDYAIDQGYIDKLIIEKSEELNYGR